MAKKIFILTTAGNYFNTQYCQHFSQYGVDSTYSRCYLMVPVQHGYCLKSSQPRARQKTFPVFPSKHIYKQSQMTGIAMHKGYQSVAQIADADFSTNKDNRETTPRNEGTRRLMW